MATKPSTRSPIDQSHENTIYVTRRETVAIIAPSSYAERTMVEEAFFGAGTYLNQEASKGIDPGTAIELEFEFRGVKFVCSAFQPKDGEG